MFGSNPFKLVKTRTAQGIRYHLIDENLDFVDWHRDYINQLAADKCAPSTLFNNARALHYLASYMHEMGKSLIDFDERRDLLFGYREWLRATDINNQARTTSLEDSSINAYMRCACAFLRKAYIKGLLKTDPIPYIENRSALRKHGPEYTEKRGTQRSIGLIIPCGKSAPKFLRRELFELALTKATGLRDKAILITLYEGGFRAGELLGMRVGDIDFEQGGIHVVDREDNPNGARATNAGRFVLLPEELMALLGVYLSEEWIDTSPKHEMLWINTKSPNRKQRGDWMTKSTLDSLFRTCSKRSGFHMNPHLMRHSHVTNLALGYRNKGEAIDWKFIADRVGHSSVEITMDVYSHLSDESNKAEYERVRTARLQEHQ